MADRLYKPGSRNKKRFTPNTGKMSKNRLAWVRTAIGQLVIMRYPHEEEIDPDDEGGRPTETQEVGTTYTLLIPLQGRRPVSLNITALTMAEFKKTRQLFDLLFELAEPVIRERDKVAQDAFAKGDDSYNRVYREIPTFVVRERPEQSDVEGVQHGPSGVPDGAGGDGDSPGRLRGSGDELADGEPEEGRGQDDGTQADQP